MAFQVGDTYEFLPGGFDAYREWFGRTQPIQSVFWCKKDDLLTVDSLDGEMTRFRCAHVCVVRMPTDLAGEWIALSERTPEPIDESAIPAIYHEAARAQAALNAQRRESGTS